MKAIKFSDKSIEVCPFCEEEVELGHSVENCPNCGKAIACCSMCDVISNDSVCVTSLSSCGGCVNASNFVLNSLVDKETTEEVNVDLNI
jgi:hypothetical protein